MTAGIAASKPDRGRQQRLGDARRDDREIGRLRLRDADEAVHDAPDGAEQPDERRGRADGGQRRHAVAHRARLRARDFGETRRGALLDAAFARAVGRQRGFRAARPRSSARQHIACSAERHLRFRQACAPRQCAPSASVELVAARRASWRVLAEKDRPGHERGEDQADHHRFDQHVGGQKHRPRRQVALQPARPMAPRWPRRQRSPRAGSGPARLAAGTACAPAASSAATAPARTAQVGACWTTADRGLRAARSARAEADAASRDSPICEDVLFILRPNSG